MRTSRGPRGGPRARKSLGQHFLRDSGVLADIAAAVGGAPQAVLEIGAGTGQLTEALLAAGHEVTAVEIEPRLVRHLRSRFRGNTRLRLVEADARDLDLAALALPDRGFTVAGNLPYFAASYIVRRLLESPTQAAALVVMVQREVAREITAKSGDLSLLSISVLVYAESEMLFDVPPEAFDPPPRVWSSVIRLRPRDEPLVPAQELPAFFAFVSRVFRTPRKQIRNAIGLPREAATALLADAGVQPARRPETLSVREWLTLCRLAAAAGPVPPGGAVDEAGDGRAAAVDALDEVAVVGPGLSTPLDEADRD